MSFLTDLLQYLQPYGHWAEAIILGLLLACGFGLPMPEDIILVTGGILASQGITDFLRTNIIGMVGVLVGDGIIYFMGRHFGHHIKKIGFFKSLLDPRRDEKIRKWFKRYGDKVIFFARFAPGLRMPLFMTSGIYRVSPWKFFLLDGMAALISVPVWIRVGYVTGNNLERLEELIRQFQLGIYGVMGFLLVLILVIWFCKKKIEAKFHQGE